MNIKQWLSDFAKKNWKVLLILLWSIAVVIYIIITQIHIKNMAAENATLKAADKEIQKNRDFYKSEKERLDKENKAIQHAKDSISVIKEKTEIKFQALLRKHRREIDSLTNAAVPNDSIYKRLQPIYPNIYEEPLAYPFSGGQIRQIYGIAVSYPRIQKEYTMQTGLMQTCNLLNMKYKDSENNYKAQLDVMSKNISACDQQIAGRDQQLKLKQKELNRKSFWNWVYKGVAIAVGAVAIFK